MTKKLYEVTVETSFFVYADKPPDETSSYIRDTIRDHANDGCYSVDARETKHNTIGAGLDELVCQPRGEPYLSIGEVLALVNPPKPDVDPSQMTLEVDPKKEPNEEG